MQVLVIGGGASGMMAAIHAAAGGCRVTLLEQNKKLGKKLYATGNGKCNLTNLQMHPGDYRGNDPAFAVEALRNFSVSDTLSTFSEMGLMTKERYGYVYPHSEQAKSVVSILTLELRRLGVRVLLSCKALCAGQENGVFYVDAELTEEGRRQRLFANCLVLASGGLAGQNLGTGEVGYEICRLFGHRLFPTVPALVQLQTAERFLRPAAGCRADADVTLQVGEKNYRENGEIIVTDYGISGIPILQLSRYVAMAKKEEVCVLHLNFFPGKEKEDIRALVEIQLQKSFALERTAEEAFCGMLPDKLLYALLKEAGISGSEAAGCIHEQQRKRLASLFGNLRLTVTKTLDFTKAQATAGGVDVSEIHPHTMESRRIPGLYITGELLDIDGTCGGYNLQWAWTSGALAGKALAKAVKP